MQMSNPRLLIRNSRKFSTAIYQKLTGDDYQYVHKSDMPTYYFQKSLRRLPIPKLPDTCRKFLASAEAVLSKEKLGSLKALVNDFATHEGPELQRELVLHDQRNLQTSFISEPWFDVYLSDRAPCPVNYNPFMVYAPDPQKEYNDQVKFHVFRVLRCVKHY
ncbi:unnamed protein product [Gongylonema pulchrum]|uniref:Carn_acyltransf domain-containing protein n=1 Tax=Gongylonema pulchrum TaxID=637853 RepID=A0A183EU35_9BILA|nr:unnamed protein product [Gongylonema pulchrum]